MIETWQSWCPYCGENVYIGLDCKGGDMHFLRCERCGTVWTMGELEVYELTHPSEETTRIVNMLMNLAYDMAMEQEKVD